MAHIVLCPSFTQNLSKPLADRLWSLGHSSDAVEYTTDSPSYLVACENSVAALLKKHALRKPALVGYSVGGYFAACTAARWPDLISALVLIAAPASLRGALSNVSQDFGGSPVEAARRLCEGTSMDAMRLVAELRRLPASREAEALAPSIQVPTLVMAGLRDRVVPPETTLYRRIPDAGLIELDDDHFMRRSIPTIAERIHQF